jgi:hypothetical protein
MPLAGNLAENSKPNQCDTRKFPSEITLGTLQTDQSFLTPHPNHFCTIVNDQTRLKSSRPHLR